MSKTWEAWKIFGNRNRLLPPSQIKQLTYKLAVFGDLTARKEGTDLAQRIAAT